MVSYPQQERYALQERLGIGAMGEVWLATDTLLNRPVAIKYLLTPERSIHREYFLSEARVLASLQHPNITLIHDAVFDEKRQQFYLVMEYVQGDSLAKLIEDQADPLPLNITLDVAIGVLQALQYAHEHGVVHRDIKPENVIIHGQEIKLTDFGLSGLVSVLAEGTNFLAGTPEYAAPEQIQGLAVDGRADLYSLGVMLFEMVTGGHLPFEHYHKMSEVLSAHVNEIPSSPRVFVSTIPLTLEQIIMQLLAKMPDDRYPSAETLLQSLEALQTRQKLNQSGLILLGSEAKPLVGRTDELRQMEGVWGQVQKQTKPHLLVLNGAAGIGKTRLAVEFIDRKVVDRGFIALVGKSGELNIPYDPFTDIFATALNQSLTTYSIPPDQLQQLLIQIPDLTRLLQIPQPDVEIHTPDVSQVQWQFFAAVLAIFAQFGSAVIFIENATKLDEASLDLLRFLLSRDQLPLLFVAACRNVDQVDGWLNDIPVDEKTVINLGPLATPQVKTFLSQWFGDTVPTRVVSLIEKRSQGNPLRVEEAMQQLIETEKIYKNDVGQWQYSQSETNKAYTRELLSQSIQNILQNRLNRLTLECRESLVLAALIEDGPEFDFDIWLTMLGGEAEWDLAQRVLTEALEKRLVRQIDEYRYALRPAEVEQILVSDLPDEQRRSWHLAIAEAMEETNTSPILLSFQYEQAGLIDEAARLLETAGDEAAAGYAFNTAIAYYNRAVQLVEFRSVYKNLGKLYQQIGKGQASVDNYQQALILAQQAGDIADQANILNSMSLTLWLLQDQYKEAYQRAATVLNLSGAPETERAIAQSNLGMISWYMGYLKESEEWCQKAVAALRKSEDEECLATTLNRLGLAYLSLGKLSEAETSFQTSLALREKLKDSWGQAFCLNNLGKVATEHGHFEQALLFLESAHRIFERIDSRDGQMVTYTNRGRVMLYQNDFEKALYWLTKALHLAQQVGKQTAYGLSEIYLLVAQASVQNGELERARAVTNDALKIVGAVGNPEYMAMTHAALAQIYQAQGDRFDAETAFQKSLALFKEIGSLTGLLRTQLSYARFLRDAGEIAAAQKLETQTRVEAERIGLYLPPDVSTE